MRSEFRLVGLKISQTPLTSKVWPSDHREDDSFVFALLKRPVQIFRKALHSN